MLVLLGIGLSDAAKAAKIKPLSAPLNVKATAGNGYATVTWSAPKSTGGSKITKYTVVSLPGSKTCKTTGVKTCTVRGLTNGISYSFKVTAKNLKTTGPASIASLAVTPATTPSAPTDVIGTSGNKEVVVSWTAPTLTGGSAITSYTVTSSPLSQTCIALTASSCTVTGLENGTSYTFTVSASNSIGVGPASIASGTVTPMPTAPSLPTNVVVDIAIGRATVSWDAPLSDGGSVVTGYTVTAYRDLKTCTTDGATSCTFTGLANGAEYAFAVVAKNAIGESVASELSVWKTLPNTPYYPSIPIVTAGDESVTATWRAPKFDRGSPVTGYTVTSSPEGKTCTTTGDLTCTVTGLTNGTTYTFSVTATNAVGVGLPSANSLGVVPAPVPVL